MMAIVVAGLGSAPIRRLHSSWAQVPKADMEVFKDMDTVLDSRVSEGGAFFLGLLESETPSSYFMHHWWYRKWVWS